ncbi:TPA: NAD(P)H-binding protein [Staphylococcus aureus]|nr:NAD(P)H-binding protein [Staphylococcus aureus]HDG8586567.1 NAD(P)H-binding protein [Staphylococcus aureus]HDZ3299420.1 NAD(P)H-binding protein [Staphylococcus aureus]HDZ3315741.1 NAD(P)H-binding protein [Staphylococcus aureus]HDZ3340400.1 NAD(P)H-binding protein [Staphylococcus aureus]
MNIMITGATGQLANYAIEYVQAFNPEANIYGLVRKQEQVEQLAQRGLNVRIGDYADQESLIKAFKDIDRLLFISVPQSDLQINVVEAAKASDISYIAYTSINGIEYTKNGLEINHRYTERLINESGIPHTFLRNSWYLAMEEGSIKAAIETGNYYYLSDGKISYATRKEYAEAAARVITSEDKMPEIVELGRTAFTHKDLAQAIEKARGQKLNIQKVDKATYDKHLSQYSAMNIESLMQQYVAEGNNGEADVVDTDFVNILGHELQPLSDAIKHIIKE